MVAHGLQQVDDQVKEWTKPTLDRQITGVATDLFRSKKDLITENAFLRQQLIVLKRQTPERRSITSQDRRVLVILASRIRGWREALVIVKPDTLVRWQHQGFKLFWRCKSRGKPGRPPLATETSALIEAMATDNRRWGAKRIRGELLKLGDVAGQSCVGDLDL